MKGMQRTKTKSPKVISLFLTLLLASIVLKSDNYDILRTNDNAFDCQYIGYNASVNHTTIANLPGNGNFAYFPANQWINRIGTIFLLAPFKFNGANYTTCQFSSNGYIWFGTGSAPANNANANQVLSLPSLGNNNFGVIAACATSLIQHPNLASNPIPGVGGSGLRLVQYRLEGATPNRCTVIEFLGFKPNLSTTNCSGVQLNDNHRVDFQIRLFEDNVNGNFPNRIQITYKNQNLFCNDQAYSFQVGIRGVSPDDFACRTQTSGNLTSNSASAGIANTDKINFSSGDRIVGNEVAFIFDQLTSPNPLISPVSPISNICPNNFVTLTTSTSFGQNQWFKNGVALLNETGIQLTVTENGSYTLSNTINCGLSGTSAPALVNINPCSAELSFLSASQNSICPGGSFQTAYQIIGTFNSGNTFTVQLSDVNGIFTTPINVGQISSISSGTISITIPSNTLPGSGYLLRVVSSNPNLISSQTFSLLVQSVPSFSLIQTPNTNNLCNGPINLEVPNDYSNVNWLGTSSNQNQITVTSQGTFSAAAIGVDGCLAQSNSVQLIQTTPTLVNVSVSPSNYLCNGPVNLTATSGMSNYQWSNGTLGLVNPVSLAGLYTITAEDANGCTTISNPIQVFSAYDFNVQIAANSSLICNNQPVSLSSTGNFLSYNWSNGLTSSSIQTSIAGTYNLSVTDSNGCSSVSNSINIQTGNTPSASFSNDQFSGFTVIFSNTSQGAETYLWQFGDGNSNTLQNPEHNYPIEGDYSVTLIVTNSCGSDTTIKNINVKKLLTIQTLFQNSFLVYPNPFENEINISFENIVNKGLTLNLVDIFGRIVFEKSELQAAQTLKITLADLPKGFYLLQIQQNNSMANYKLIRK